MAKNKRTKDIYRKKLEHLINFKLSRIRVGFWGNIAGHQAIDKTLEAFGIEVNI